MLRVVGSVDPVFLPSVDFVEWWAEGETVVGVVGEAGAVFGEEIVECAVPVVDPGGLGLMEFGSVWCGMLVVWW
jgi:hypothetical protein